MARPKVMFERLHVTLPEGTKKRIDSVLEKGEDRLKLIRMGIDKEIERRLKKSKTAAKKA